MLKHLAGLLAPPTPEGVASEAVVIQQLQEKFPLLVFSCLQLSSKLLLQSQVRQLLSLALAGLSLI